MFRSSSLFQEALRSEATLEKGLERGAAQEDLLPVVITQAGKNRAMDR